MTGYGLLLSAALAAAADAGDTAPLDILTHRDTGDTVAGRVLATAGGVHHVQVGHERRQFAAAQWTVALAARSAGHAASRPTSIRTPPLPAAAGPQRIATVSGVVQDQFLLVVDVDGVIRVEGERDRVRGLPQTPRVDLVAANLPVAGRLVLAKRAAGPGGAAAQRRGEGWTVFVQNTTPDAVEYRIEIYCAAVPDARDTVPAEVQAQIREMGGDRFHSRRAAEALAGMGAKARAAVPALIDRGLGSPDYYTRRYAASALGAVAGALPPPDPYRRLAAVSLAAACETDPDADARRRAAAALGRCR